MILYVIQKCVGSDNSPDSLNVMVNYHYYGKTGKLPSNYRVCTHTHPMDNLISRIPLWLIKEDRVVLHIVSNIWSYPWYDEITTKLATNNVEVADCTVAYNASSSSKKSQYGIELDDVDRIGGWFSYQSVDTITPSG